MDKTAKSSKPKPVGFPFLWKFYEASVMVSGNLIYNFKSLDGLGFLPLSFDAEPLDSTGQGTANWSEVEVYKLA